MTSTTEALMDDLRAEAARHVAALARYLRLPDSPERADLIADSEAALAELEAIMGEVVDR